MAENNWKEKESKRRCGMCMQRSNDHPRCAKCAVLLEPKENRVTLCRCGKYHNLPSENNPEFCRPCDGYPEKRGAKFDDEDIHLREKSVMAE